jgi:CRISPR/Cas system-associated exonuclease Cas4 (RecB family)
MDENTQQSQTMTYFLEDVSRYLFDHNHSDLRNTVVVFPNRRAHLFFNKHLSGFSSSPIWAPQYFTISDFVQQISALQLADPLTLIFRLFKVYKEVTGSNETFDTFYYYCEMILADFDDIDKNRVDAGMIYQDLSDLKAIDNYYEYLSELQITTIRQFWETFVSTRNSEEKDKFINLWDALKKIYVKFNEQLDAEGIAYEGKVYRKAVDSLKVGTSMPFDGKQIAFVGFNALNRSEELLFDHYKKAGNGLFFWDFDETYINSDIHEAGFFLRKYLRQYPQPDGFKSATFLGNPQGIITTVAVPSNVAQAKVIDFCIKKVKPTDTENPGQTALVLTDEGLLLPVVNSLPANVNKVNISMGYPVMDTPSFSFITALADLQINKRKKDNGKGYLFYHKDFFGLLNHVYLAGIKKNAGLAQFESIAKENNIVFVDSESLGIDDPLFRKIFTSIDDPRMFGSYLTGIIKHIATDVLNWATTRKNTEWHLEILHGIYKVLVRYEALSAEIDINLSFQTVINLLRKILKGITVPFSGEPLTGLQIMGILETRTLDFENLIILSMNEGKFPKTGHVPSMIPFSLREGFGLPTVKHQDAIYGYYFYRLLHRAKKIILVYNTKTEGMQRGEPSRFIYQLRYDSGFKIDEINLGYKVAPFLLRTIKSDKTPEAINRLDKYLRPEGKSYMSPSALNTYLNCKLRFYYQYIEGMHEPEGIEEEIEANVFGSILHRTMHILYNDFTGQELEKKHIELIRKNKKAVGDAIDTAFAEEYLGKATINKNDLHGRNLIIRKVIEKYTHGILAFDTSTAPFRIISLEELYTHELLLAETGKKLAIGGYIDRLDEKDGCIRIIDYKTGRAKSTFKDIDDLFNTDPSNRNQAAFQTFLYSLVLKEKFAHSRIIPALFYVRRIYMSDFDYHVYRSENRTKTAVNDFGEYAQAFEERLMLLVNDMFDENVPFTQTGDTKFCERCPYNAICRRKT